MTTSFILGIVILAPYGALSNTVVNCEPDINNRLATLEAALEFVLVKNAELESRIERLEEENRRLKEKATKIADPREVEKNEIDGENANGATKTSRPIRTADNTIKRINSKLPRMVLSEDTSIGFTAVISKKTISNLGQGQSLVYDKVITNVGGGYHSPTGIFIAPVSGVYVFNFDTMFENGDTQFLDLVQDGHTVFQALGHNYGQSRYLTTSRTVVLQVNQGGEVWIRTGDFQDHGPGRVHGNTYTSFSGWLL